MMAKHDSGEEGIYEGDGDGTEDYGAMARVRAKRKPYYSDAEAVEDEWDEEAEHRNEDEEDMEILKMEQNEDFCRVCGLAGKLLCCHTCPGVYHLACLDPPLKIAPTGRWSCPTCVDPLENLEKILDCQMRPLRSPGSNEEGGGSSSSRLIKQYLVKWKGRSYLHCSWVKQEDLDKAMKTFSGIKMKLSQFQRQLEAAKKLSTSDEDRVVIRPEWTTVDRILDIRQSGDIKEYFVKWKDLGYDELSWELEEDVAPFQAEIGKYKGLLQKGAAKALMKRKLAAGLEVKEAKRRRKEIKAFKKTPKFLHGGSLHRFQMDGLNFLRFAWQDEKNVILADETGLGKTIQAVAFLAALAEEGVPFPLPHLVVAPTPTLQNWEREFSTWAPSLNVVTYGGSSEARAYIRDLEFYYPNKLKLKDKMKKKQFSDLKQSKQERVKFDVLLTSHEMAGLDQSVLKSINWECLIVDEGHRLKNKDSVLFSTLESLSTHHRVLLTGASLPTNLEDLVMLARFLLGKFSRAEEFHHEFRDLHPEEQVLHVKTLFAQHMLRRLKRDVMRELPAKKELILRVELTPLQREYYRGILTRNYQILSRPGGPQFALNNVMMELRKLCAHPFMLDGAEPDARSEQEANRQMLEASEKLFLLEKMMAKMRVQGHRVLIYSQFTRMLDILEEWLLYKKWGYERIDGKINGAERQIRIDRFNAQNSTRFCFLLSTQAGVGINLASADTVIIYDSDWNPHADLQAMARAHVMIYRLVTRGTIEERMMQMTRKRMVLEHNVMGRAKTQVFSQEELDDMLKYGTKELFYDGHEMGRHRPIHYDDTAIDRLLDRAQMDGGDDRLNEREANELARAYKVSTYDHHDEDFGDDHRRHTGSDRHLSRQDASERSYFWHSLLKDKVDRPHHPEDSDEHKGKRSRKQYSGYHHEEDDLAGMAAVSSDEDDYDYPSHMEHGSASYMRDKFQPPRKKQREEMLEDVRPEPPPLMEGDGRSLKVLGFTQKQRLIFVQVLMRYGLGDFTWSDFLPRLKQKTREEIKEYGTLFLSHIAEDIIDSQTFSDGVPKEGLRIQDVLVRLAVLHLIGDKVRLLQENPDAPLLSIGARNHRYYSLRNTKVWKEEHDRKLLQAILKLGYGRWQAIVDEPELGLQSVIRNEILLRENSGDGRTADGELATGSTATNTENNLDGGSDEKGSDDDAPGDGLGPGGNKENSEAYMQKKMVDFVKRRVLVLEKVLNAEYLKESSDPGATEEMLPAAGETRSKMPNAPLLDGIDGRGQSVKRPPVQIYPMPLSPEEISAAAVDDDPNRLKVAQIYGQMCELMLENQGDADQAYVGNKSAGLRLRKSLRQLDTLCLEMRKALFGQPLQSRKVRPKPDEGVEGAEVEAQSDENDDAGVDSENDNDNENENELDVDADLEVDHDVKLEEKVKASSSSESGHSSAEAPSGEEQQDVSRETSSDNEEKPTKRFEPVSKGTVVPSAPVKMEPSAVPVEGSSVKRIKGAKVFMTPKQQYSDSL
ncbi:unnamed protein product [Calypogeia fissa]